MKLPFFRLFTAAAVAAGFVAFASAQEPASSPAPKPQAPVAQKPPGAEKTNGGPVYEARGAHGAYGNGVFPFDRSAPEIMRASQLQAIVAEVVVFGCPVLIVALTVFGRYRRAQLLHHTLRAMVEKDWPIPPELLVPPKPPANDFRRGVLLISLGVGLMGLLATHAGKGAWGIALVPLMLGIGYLAVAKVGTKPPAGPGPTLPL